MHQADGTTLHWEEWGEGPGALIAPIAYSYPATVRWVVEASLRRAEPDSRAGPGTSVGAGTRGPGGGGTGGRVKGMAAYCSPESAVARVRNWTDRGGGDSAGALGDRLWVLYHPRNPWF